MSRFTEDEVKTIITNVMTLLNEDVFGTMKQEGNAIKPVVRSFVR